MSQLHSQPLVVSDDPFECVSGIPVKGSSQQFSQSQKHSQNINRVIDDEQEKRDEPNNNLGPDSQPLFGENGSIGEFNHSSNSKVFVEETEILESRVEVESDNEMIIDEKNETNKDERMDDSDDLIIEFNDLVDPIPPTIDLNQRKRVKGLTAPKFSKEKGILVTEVREIAIRLEHPNLSNYERLCLTFTNTYDSSQELIRLGLDSHFCPYEKNDSFLEIYHQDVKSTTLDEMITLDLSSLPVGAKDRELSFKFGHATSCYKTANQECFKALRNNSKSPIFNMKMWLENSFGDKSGELVITLKVGKNVGREFKKMSEEQMHLSMKNRKRKPNNKKNTKITTTRPDADLGDYNAISAETDDFMILAIPKRNLEEIEKWKKIIEDVKHSENLNHNSTDKYPNVGNDISFLIANLVMGPD